MNLPRLLLTAAAACLLACMSFAQTQPQIDSLVHHYQEHYQLPGLAIAIIRPDTLYLGVSGRKQIKEKAPIQSTDLFHIGSNTKAFTAFLAARLVEAGKIAWEDSLYQFLPELFDKKPKVYQSVTLEDLLSHRAGIAPFESTGTREFRALPRSMPEDETARLAFAKAALSLPPQDLTPQEHLYSNGGYIVAALMLERATGSSYEVLLQEMADELEIQLSFGFPKARGAASVFGHRKKTLAFLSARNYRALAPDNSFAMPAYFAPAGDLSISLQDLAFWAQLHLNGLLGQGNYLQPETYQRLHYGRAGYAMGWYNGTIGKGGERFSYHGGSLGTFSSAILLSPNRQVGLVILINAESKFVQKAKEEIRVDLWSQYGKSN